MAQTLWIPFEGGFIVDADSAEDACERINGFLEAIARADAEGLREYRVSSVFKVLHEQQEPWPQVQERHMRELRSRARAERKSRVRQNLSPPPDNEQ